MVECTLFRIVIRKDLAERQYIFLREKDGTREFPIVIGFYEVQEIYRKVRGDASVRPLTHDLVRAVIREMGGTLNAVEIDALRENTFFAKLVIQANGKTLRLDCRPSDAVALAVAEKVTVFVDDSVLNAAPGNAEEP